MVLRKRFGQHFLRDTTTIDAIIRLIAPKPHDQFIEIGPGEGVLTKPLLAHDSSVHAIEIDRDLGAKLAPLSRQYPKFQLTIEDFLIWLPTHSPIQSIRWVGNLPYNITTPIFFGLLAHAPSLIDAHFMIQKEVGERLTAAPDTKSYGRLTVMMQYHFNIAYCLDVPPNAFSPPPKVDSCIVRFTPRPAHSIDVVDQNLFSTVVKTAFQYRRKQLGNALKSICDTAVIRAANLDPNSRAENLHVEDFVLLCNTIEKQVSYRSNS